MAEQKKLQSEVLASPMEPRHASALLQHYADNATTELGAVAYTIAMQCANLAKGHTVQNVISMLQRLHSDFFMVCTDRSYINKFKQAPVDDSRFWF